MPKPINTKPIQDEWTRFAAAVLPAGVSKVQRVDMRRAFFGGAAGLWKLMTNRAAEGGILDPGETETMRDMAHMAAIEAEIIAFNQAVKEGEA